MQKLILVKHAAPLVDPATTSDQWRLSDAGREQCDRLADQLAPWALGSILASEEPKASETAEIVAAKMKIPFQTASGLHEHDRRNVPHMRTREFISMVELFFRKHEEHVLGSESADEALERFSKAIDNAVSAASAGNLAIVAHGTVIALYLAAQSERNGFELWRQMGLPSFAVLSLPDRAVEQIVDRV